MAKFSLYEGTRGSKRKKRSNEEEDDLKKRACGVEEQTSESSENEAEESNEIGDEVEDFEDIEATEEDGVSGGGNTDGEFKFRIDPDVLDCSICFEPLRPPIFECRNGHIACSYCCPKLLNKCHFCCQPIGRHRCLALEKVVESITSRCQYANYGCRAILSFAEKASHEEACSHAALFCPISNCTFSGSKSLLFTHAKDMHGNISKTFFYDHPFLVVLEKQQPLMVLLGRDLHFFLLLNNHEIFPGNGNVLSVICMASNKPEYEFSCELKVKTMGSSLRLRTSAEKVKKWNGVHPCKAFLVVPDGFDSTNARLRINLDEAMARFSLYGGTSGSKRKKRSNEEEDDLKKRTCGVEAETSEWSENEEEESNEIGDEVEDFEEIEATGEDEVSGGGNKDREFKFRIDPDVLDCTICFEPLRPPIFECRNGHIACSYCCPKLLNKCHFCCEPIGRRRCVALEKVLESITSPCQYANYGCRAILSFAEKASHEEACSHAALFCPISNCTFSGSKSLLCSHAKHMHGNISKKFFYDQPFLVVLEKQQPLMVLLGEDSHIFLLLNNHEMFPGNGNVLSIICMASNNPEYEFSCELRVKTRGSSLRLRTSAEKVKKWNGVHPCKAFLVVPDGFDTTTARLPINVCINKSLS
ncbi:hypothetical protein M5K25_004571 [Dendrobium thyrsiflorum]|uniref:RING-type E3 ubiquitin transferase n=1 Tax=Dendrobium thyrsiflorum TaxID=117978 RepID=A0ABD0VGE1_DENTH